jgi:hypothetical protein
MNRLRLYRGNELDVNYYPKLLDDNTCSLLYNYFLRIFKDQSRRSSIVFGDEGLIYSVINRENETNTLAVPWSTFPGLIAIKELIETITQQKYTICIVQSYPNGKIGINPHRDKEMVSGTRIAGLSIGAERTISFTRDNESTINIKLENGSLYIMNPPTNQKWLHSIVKDHTIKDTRFSLTFRDYHNFA